MGNSEVGHMTIGAGRVIKQYLVDIEDRLDDGSFAQLPEFVAGINHCHTHQSVLHLLHIF